MVQPASFLISIFHPIIGKVYDVERYVLSSHHSVPYVPLMISMGYFVSFANVSNVALTNCGDNPLVYVLSSI